MVKETWVFEKSNLDEQQKKKILEFLIIHSDLDYTLKEISRYSKVKYSITKKILNSLLKEKWIIITRKIKKVNLYKLNLKNKKVKEYIDRFWEEKE